MRKSYYEKMIVIHQYWFEELCYLSMCKIKRRGLIDKLIKRLITHHKNREQLYWEKWLSYERVHCKFFIKD